MIYAAILVGFLVVCMVLTTVALLARLVRAYDRHVADLEDRRDRAYLDRTHAAQARGRAS